MLELKYGCNPNQAPASISIEEGKMPLEVLNGKPGYINFLDALNGWQLVKELKESLGLPAATSFKHVSPAGAAVGLPLTEDLSRAYFIDNAEKLSGLACAYARARGADRLSSYGDFIALSDICDLDTARLIQGEVSDGIIAPGYTDEALEILRTKRKGSYSIIKIDNTYLPDEVETKQVFGLTFTQNRNNAVFSKESFTNIVTENRSFSKTQIRDLILSLVTLKYTQSNSVCYVKDGQAIGIGAGQQSRIHCTRLAGNKADIWWLRQHPKVLGLKFIKDIRRPDRDNAIDIYLSDEWSDLLADDAWADVFAERPEPISNEEKKSWIAQNTGVTLGSDAFFPFGDNIQRAHRSGVTAIAQPGGSIRDDHVIATCNKYGITMAFTGVRLFHH